MRCLCSYTEESNADAAIKALTSALAPKAKALRDGNIDTIDATGLVPGTATDLLKIANGSVMGSYETGVCWCFWHTVRPCGVCCEPQD